MDQRWRHLKCLKVQLWNWKQTSNLDLWVFGAFRVSFEFTDYQRWFSKAWMVTSSGSRTNRHQLGHAWTVLMMGFSQVLVVNLNQLKLLFVVLPSFFWSGGGGRAAQQMQRVRTRTPNICRSKQLRRNQHFDSELQMDSNFLGLANSVPINPSSHDFFFWRKHITTTNFDISCSAWLNTDFGPEADALVIGSGAGLSARLSLRKFSWFLNRRRAKKTVTRQVIINAIVPTTMWNLLTNMNCGRRIPTCWARRFSTTETTSCSFM